MVKHFRDDNTVTRIYFRLYTPGRQNTTYYIFEVMKTTNVSCNPAQKSRRFKRLTYDIENTQSKTNLEVAIPPSKAGISSEDITPADIENYYRLYSVAIPPSKAGISSFTLFN